MTSSAFSFMLLPVALFLRLLGSSVVDSPVKAVNWSEKKWHHESEILSRAAVHTLTLTNPIQYAVFNSTLDVLLTPRVPGTRGHENVRKFIVETMKSLDWEVEEDTFIATTPHGEILFTNIVSTLNPNACEQLVLACHYDSKYFSEGTFYGATDSAVPCTMMIHLARILDKQLKQQKKKFPIALNIDTRDKSGEHVLILLDLLGAADPQFHSYFDDTYGLYIQLVNVERRLNAMKRLELSPPLFTTNYFYNKNSFSFVEDDHLPFLKRGVPILHLIPNPFPYTWHLLSDDKQHLHHPTINNLNKILTVFVAQYLQLNIVGT
ncbi:glutaminyl-peptide cyclotransferase-like [Limulus polyphemus]|uniref:glutaminyl-peptide cyclotransferase n=1 Tax=Limulus polyphemus TaxID=6850 RepID=A0ABM1BID0_LIMPO|nr:glutaminyl-peptide cyclotransferase-like [Limulus polyphemus]